MKVLSKINSKSSLYDILYTLTEQNIVKYFNINFVKYSTIQELKIYFNDESAYLKMKPSLRAAFEKGLKDYLSTVCCCVFTGGSDYWFYPKIKPYKIKNDELVIKFQKTGYDRQTFILSKNNHQNYILNFFESTIVETENSKLGISVNPDKNRFKRYL